MKPESMQADLIAALQDQGLRITKARKALTLEIESRRGTFTAEEISESLPEVGRATVFRTLKVLVDSGTICRVNTPLGAPIYTRARVEHHHHTYCVNCADVQEIRLSNVELMLEPLGREVKGQIVGHSVDLFIICDRCVDAVSQPST